MVKLVVKKPVSVQVPNIKDDLFALIPKSADLPTIHVCDEMFTEEDIKRIKAKIPKHTSEAKIRLQMIRNRIAALKMNGKVTTLKELDEVLNLL